MKRLKAIAAMSENRVIGQGNRIPWHLPEDFKWFKQVTTGHIIVMGRKTFQSIGRPLPNRETIVLSRSNFAYPGIRTITNLHEIDPSRESRDIFICGGAEIYAQTLHLCSDLYLTLVKGIMEGDAFFPKFEDAFQLDRVLNTYAEFEIRHYTSKSHIA